MHAFLDPYRYIEILQIQASYVARFCVYIHLEYIVIQAYILSIFFILCIKTLLHLWSKQTNPALADS